MDRQLGALAKTEKTIAECTEKFKEIESALSTAKEIAAERNAEVDQLKAVNAQLDGRVEELNSELRDVKKRELVVITAKDAKIAAKDAEIRNLKAANDTLIAKIALQRRRQGKLEKLASEIEASLNKCRHSEDGGDTPGPSSSHATRSSTVLNSGGSIAAQGYNSLELETPFQRTERKSVVITATTNDDKSRSEERENEPSEMDAAEGGVSATAGNTSSKKRPRAQKSPEMCTWIGQKKRKSK